MLLLELVGNRSSVVVINSHFSIYTHSWVPFISLCCQPHRKLVGICRLYYGTSHGASMVATSSDLLNEHTNTSIQSACTGFFLSQFIVYQIFDVLWLFFCQRKIQFGFNHNNDKSTTFNHGNQRKTSIALVELVYTTYSIRILWQLSLQPTNTMIRCAKPRKTHTE